MINSICWEHLEIAKERFIGCCRWLLFIKNAYEKV